ncbi:MAG: hypothetical protein ACI30S_00825 [Muribaculaceae bacterium]
MVENDQASSLRSSPGLKHDSMLSEPAGRWQRIENRGGRGTPCPYDNNLEIREMHGGRDTSRPYDKRGGLVGQIIENRKWIIENSDYDKRIYRSEWA